MDGLLELTKHFVQCAVESLRLAGGRLGVMGHLRRVPFADHHAVGDAIQLSIVDQLERVAALDDRAIVQQRFDVATQRKVMAPFGVFL